MYSVPNIMTPDHGFEELTRFDIFLISLFDISFFNKKIALWFFSKKNLLNYLNLMTYDTQ